MQGLQNHTRGIHLYTWFEFSFFIISTRPITAIYYRCYYYQTNLCSAHSDIVQEVESEVLDDQCVGQR